MAGLSALVVLRFSLAIVFDALAFTVWDVGTRSPVSLVRDLARGARRPRTLALGGVRFLVGLGLLVLAAAIVLPAVPGARTFTLLETGMLIAALLVEQLIGPDLRRRLRRPA